MKLPHNHLREDSDRRHPRHHVHFQIAFLVVLSTWLVWLIISSLIEWHEDVVAKRINAAYAQGVLSERWNISTPIMDADAYCSRKNHLAGLKKKAETTKRKIK